MAALARDHIIKLREERQRFKQEWAEEYSTHASSAKIQGLGLNVLRAEYVHRYNQLLERETQPHRDFFVNLSMEIEEEVDFDEETLVDVSQYEGSFEWDEGEYMRLRFLAARHYAS